MHALRLALRAAWWRKGLSLTILLIATLAVAAAVIGPLYGRGAEESQLREHLGAAGVGETGVTLTRNNQRNPTSTVLSPGDDLPTTRPSALLASVRKRANDPLLRTYFGPPHYSLRTQPDTALHVPTQQRPAALARISWRDTQCQTLTFVSGRCPTGDREAVLSIAAADYLSFRVGASMTVTVAGANIPLRVVGIYRIDDPGDARWFGHTYNDAQPGAQDGPDRLDTVFVSQQTLLSAGQGVFADAERALRLDRVRLDDVPVLTRRLAALKNQLASSREHVVPTAKLPDIVSEITDERRTVTVSALLSTVQLVVLTWFVLYLVVANTIEERSDEIALAKLRGLSPAGTASFGLAEPMLLLVLAVPLGLAVGFLAAWQMVGAFLLDGTPIALRLPVLAWAVASAMGAAAAAGLAARSLLTRPLLEQLNGEAEQGARVRRPVVLDAMVLVLAGAGVYQLLRTAGGGADPADGLALLTPGLVALAAGLFGSRLLPLLARSLHRRTRRPRRLSAFLASRHVARRPAALRLVVLVCVAAALATFAVDAWVVAARNRGHVAAQEVGAAEVLHVSAPSTLGLLEAVRAADPTGRHAMAVVEFIPTGSVGPNRVLAVDSSRWAAVGSWVPAWSSTSIGELARRLRPPAPPPVVLDGREARLRVRSGTPAATPTYLSLQVKTARGAETVSLGRIRSGTHDYTGRLPSCPNGCRVSQVSVERNLGDFAPVAGDFTLLSIGTEAGELDGGFDDERRWVPVRENLADPTAALPVDIEAGPEGLEVRFSTQSSEVPRFAPVDTPTLQPVVAVRSAPPAAVPEVRGASLGTTLDGAQQLVRVVGTSAVLPRAGRQGTVVDLVYAERAATDPDTLVEREVWLASGAPPSVRKALTANGLRVTGVEKEGDRRGVLDRQGPALALRLFLVAAIVSVLLALAAAATMVYVGARHRAYEIAAMRSLGVRSSQLVGSVTREQAWLLCAGTLLGTAAGAVAAWLALPAYPLGGSDGTGPPLALAPAYLWIGVLTVLVLALCAVVAHVSARVVVRAGRPDRLREARG